MYDDVIYHGRFIWNRLKAEANHRKHGIKGINPFVSSLARSCPCKHGRDLALFVNNI